VTAWLLLKFLPLQLSVTKQIQPSGDGKDNTVEAVERAKSVERRLAEVIVEARDLRLWVEKGWFGKMKRREILQGITVDFEPGKLNVIMGPSGNPRPFCLPLRISIECVSAI
jgi:hypothetical protein